MNIWNTLAGRLLMTLLISMVPVIELRGAIPIAVAHGLDFWPALVTAVVGNLIPVPFIIVFIRRIFQWMRKKSRRLEALVEKMEARADKKRGTVEKYEFWGLVVLVAIPLPGTGAWTGALVAAMMDMRLKRAMPAIVLGVVIAAMIVSALTLGAGAILS